jgi:hypothetical protein
MRILRQIRETNRGNLWTTNHTYPPTRPCSARPQPNPSSRQDAKNAKKKRGMRQMRTKSGESLSMQRSGTRVLPARSMVLTGAGDFLALLASWRETEVLWPEGRNSGKWTSHCPLAVIRSSVPGRQAAPARQERTRPISPKEHLPPSPSARRITLYIPSPLRCDKGIASDRRNPEQALVRGLAVRPGRECEMRRWDPDSSG